ncbi:MAG: NUDIX domain-containing protein [Porticoccaceae bacterium]|nr:NUDIX domain-containing protein [Pseudomonadales bacterium]MCP5303571.1 NUDIX domain-containing protein [Pseudomonadales bacterium]
MAFPDHQFSSKDVEILQERTVYKGFFRMQEIQLRHRLFDGGWSQVVERELMRRGEAVGVIPYDPENRLIGLVEQFRVGAIADGDHWLFELVAGMRDGSEPAEQAVERELLEESGLVARELHEICDCWVSPGGTDEKVRLFCAIADLSGAAGVFGMPDEHEDILFHVLPEADVYRALEQGKCNNFATVVALQWLQLNQEKLIG